MRNPTSAQARFVAGQFTQALEKYPHLRLDMSNGSVNISVFFRSAACVVNKTICGTVHCHGGTYALERCDLDEPLIYSHGAHMMAVDLGFETMGDLELWAHTHPDIWGNTHGSAMFASSLAFISKDRPWGAGSVCDIRNHWNEVADRLERLEAGETIEQSIYHHDNN